MMSTTARLKQARKVRHAVMTYLRWLEPANRCRPEAMAARNDWLITARRELDILWEDHVEEMRARMHARKAVGK